MTSVPVWSIVVAGLFIATMLMSALVALVPSSLRLTAPVVCPRGATMSIRRLKASYHRPGESGLYVTCEGSGGGENNVLLRAMLVLWLALLVPSLAAAWILLPPLVASLPK